MIWILAISIFLQTNVLCASIKSSLVSFDNNLRTLNSKIVVDEKQQKIDQLLETVDITEKVVPAIIASDEIDEPLKQLFFDALLAQTTSVIKADDPKLRNDTLSALYKFLTKNIKFKEIMQTLIPTTPSALTRQEMMHNDRLTFLIFMSRNRATLEDKYTNTNAPYGQGILRLSEYVFATKEESARDPETDKLIEFMKNSGNKRLQEIAEDCEYLWSISNAEPQG